MTELKKKTKTAHHVDMDDLCSYLSEKTGIEVSYTGADYDTDYAVDVESEPELDGWDQSRVDEFLKNGFINMDGDYRTILTYCANQGWLEEGSYVFEVFW